MKILCLVDKYYPESNANTVCCDCIMNFFKENGDKVDFLAIKEPFSSDFYSKYNGSNVIKIPTYYDNLMIKYGKRFNAKTWGEMPWFFRKFVALINKLKKPFRLSTGCVAYDCFNYNKILKSIKKVNSHYDIIISFCMPFAFQVVAYELMKRKLADRWYPIFLDPFVYNKCLPENKIEYRKKVAVKILKNANKIFMVYRIKQENEKNGFNPDYHKKIVEFHLPNLIDRKMPNNINKNSKNIIITYAGALYKDIRRPNEMLDIISKFPKNFTLKIFGVGCEETLKQSQEKFVNSKLEIKGNIPFVKCLDEISKSNILINIGNKITNQMPSKVFEYISFGKPVINLYYTEEDMGLEYFKQYPLCYNFNVSNYNDEDIKNLIDFCNKHAYDKLSFEDATKNLQFCLAENAVKNIYEEIKSDE